jgi:hypothetical protein
LSYILYQARWNGSVAALTKEIIMSTFIGTTVIAIALLSGISAASARTHQSDYTGRTPSSYDLNNPEEVKDFPDYAVASAWNGV